MHLGHGRERRSMPALPGLDPHLATRARRVPRVPEVGDDSEVTTARLRHDRPGRVRRPADRALPRRETTARRQPVLWAHAPFLADRAHQRPRAR
jgi:hypothetical protein